YAWQFLAGSVLGAGVGWTGTNSPNIWNMVTVVKSGDLFEAFFNGSLKTMSNMSVTIQNGGSLWFGREEIGTSYDLVGSMSDVRIYNRALSTNEVQDLYGIESDRPCNSHRAAATATLYNGFVVDANMTDVGCGYTNTPLVLIQGGG